MRSLSIRTTLGLVIGILGLLLVAVSIIALVAAVEHNRAAQKVARLAPISQDFFNSLQQHRLERGNILIAMRGDNPASKDTVDGIAGPRDATKAGYNAGFAKLSAVSGLPGTAELLADRTSTRQLQSLMRISY